MSPRRMTMTRLYQRLQEAHEAAGWAVGAGYNLGWSIGRRARDGYLTTLLLMRLYRQFVPLTRDQDARLQEWMESLVASCQHFTSWSDAYGVVLAIYGANKGVWEEGGRPAPHVIEACQRLSDETAYFTVHGSRMEGDTIYNFAKSVLRPGRGWT